METLRGRYAVIGWGSLIWDLEILSPHVSPPWSHGLGPALPIEFSRVSPKRRMALVAVIDPEHGAPCATHVVASVRASLAEAALDLGARERAPESAIGGLCVDTGFRRSRHPEVEDAVAAWCARAGARGAVWTDLPRNFAETVGKPFSLEAAEAYLLELTGEAAAEARRYMREAPAETDTPLRRRMRDRGWLDR